MKNIMPRKRSKEDVQATAYHEAGHAVVAIYLGLSVENVTIIPGEGFYGQCLKPGVLGYDYGSSRELRSIARDCIVGSYAGMAAEHLVDPESPKAHGRWDEENALWLSSEYRVFPRVMPVVGDEYHMAYLDRLRREARRHVRKQRLAIETLAAALIKRKKMTGEQVEKLVRPLLHE